MKTMTPFAAILAAGMALAPVAASAANVPIIAFGEGGGDIDSIDYGGGRLSGSMSINNVNGVNTPRNEGKSRVCDQFSTLCTLGFSVDAAPVGSGTYEGKGGGYLVITEGVTNTTLLTGTFAEPVTANFVGPVVSVEGALKDVTIDENLAAYYGVPNRGTGEMDVGAFVRYLDEEGFHGSGLQGDVVFSPVPVPAALPLMLTALAGLGLIRLRRTQTA